MHVRFSVNGTDADLDIEPGERLLDVLRDRLGLLGSKGACGRGECGACTVIVDGRPVMSCLFLAARAGRVETIEGVAEEAAGIRRAFADDGGFQCGYCTPGMIVSASALLAENPDPTEDEIKHWLTGNLCRCTGYHKIIAAIRAVAEGRTEPDPALLEVEIIKIYED